MGNKTKDEKKSKRDKKRSDIVSETPASREKKTAEDDVPSSPVDRHNVVRDELHVRDETSDSRQRQERKSRKRKLPEHAREEPEKDESSSNPHSSQVAEGKKGKEEISRLAHGSYDRYYGYRKGKDGSQDARLEVLRRDWFARKKMLDIGCNIGILTNQIARKFSPRYVIALDVDKDLINKARAYLRGIEEKANIAAKRDINDMDILVPKEYPFNVVYKCEDFVLGAHQGYDYDVITCFSVTKWIHLNAGDDGIKSLFHKAYELLKDNGTFIVEPQPWKSYKKKYSLTEDSRRNFHNIKLRPTDFENFLLKEVGFSKVEKFLPEASVKGFSRPIYVFTK